MRSFTAFCVVSSFVSTDSARVAKHKLVKVLDVAVQPAVRSDLPPCPCTIWRHCDPNDILPEHAGERSYDGTSDGQGVSCVASEDSVISMGHQVQCVPPRHGGLNYYCPPELSVKCDPAAQCRETELDTCQTSDCPGPEWLPKRHHAAFCAMAECTHAECCDQGAVAVNAAPEVTGESCEERVNALAEETMARLVAYQNECQFNAGDVNYGGQVAFSNGQFDLTDHGQAKLWAEHCQHIPVLQHSPDDVFADAQALQRECPDHARLNAQMNPMGIFATTQVLDHFWRECRNAGMDTCAPLPTETAAPALAEGCLQTFTFTVQLTNNGQEYEQSLTLEPSAEGSMRQLQCDAGPLVHGQFNLRCQGGTWVLANHGNPCYDNEQDALRQAERDRQAGGFEAIPTSIDVTGIVDRLQEDGGTRGHAHVKCCCNARLDPSLWANWRIHRSWNSRASGHTGICHVHAGHESCHHVDELTKGHERTESHRCIVSDADENWRSVLQLDRPAAPRFAQPNVPTVSSQSAEDYRDCVPAGSIGSCERCTHSVQCEGDSSYCCPYQKLCVQDSSTQCPASDAAICQGCMERFSPNPEQCESSCENPAFPRTWLPQCQ